MRPPRSNRDDEEDRIAPEAERPGIGIRQKAELNGFESVPEDRRQLEPGDPQGPEAAGLKGNAYKHDENAEINQKHADLDVRIAARRRSHHEQLDEGRDQAGRCGNALVIVSAPESEGADQ